MKNIWISANNEDYNLHNSVHIWLLRFDELKGQEQDFYNLLADEEKKRADNFFSNIDRTRYIVSKGYLRKLLEKFTLTDPEKIVFTANDYGKPALKFPTLELYFNISHSANLGLIAISDIAEIGIDVEKHKKIKTIDKIADRFFSQTEKEVLLKLPGKHKLEGFFNCWSRKEAFIKSIGRGLSFPLKLFDVTLKPGDPAELIEIREANESANQWFLQEISVDVGYSAAFCIKSKPGFSIYYRLAT